jgi:hypothetical protein
LLARQAEFSRGSDYLEHVIALTKSVLDRAPTQGPPSGGLTIVRCLDGSLNLSLADLHAYATNELAKGEVVGMTGEQVANALVNAITDLTVASCEHLGIPYRRFTPPDHD